MATIKTDIRGLVLEILLPVTAMEEYSHTAVRNVLNKYAWLGRQDRAFLKRLAEGTLEQMLRLDYVIGQFSSVKPEKMKPVILNILRMGAYQILFMESVPDSAACNEAVKLAVKKGFGGLKGFVNGVLRNIARNRDSIVYPDRKNGLSKHLSIRYSMPEWLVSLWLNRYGEDTAEEMLKAMLGERPLTVRANLAVCTPEELRKELAREGAAVSSCAGLPYAFYVDRIDRIGESKAFKEGMFTVQDVGSMLAAEAASPAPGDFVLDVCASPGGKALHLAQMTGETGSVEARDLTDQKVLVMREAFERMRLKNIRAVRADALTEDESMIEKADVVLADLPCSGLGVIGRKKDIKYRITPERIGELAALQKEILKVVSGYVRPGGVLLYSTCTISAKENEENVKWILETLPFQAESLRPYLQEAFLTGDGGKTGEKGYVQLLPGRDPSDGFFIARFRKKKGTDSTEGIG